MAIKFKEVYDKVYNTPLTTEEIKQVDRLEAWIDEEIKRRYKGGLEVAIELSIVNFKYDPITKATHYGNTSPRHELMRKEIEKRYKNAGWKIKVEIDDGLDGPNRSGPDYWVLVGKIPQSPKLSSE